MQKSLLLGVVMVMAGAASADAGIFGHRGGGCSNGSCGKSYYHGGGYGGYAVTAKTSTIAQSRPQAAQATARTSVATSTPSGNSSTVAAEASRSYQTPASNVSTARGRVLRRWAR